MSATGSSQRDQERLVQGLTVALQHPDINSHSSIVCTLLQVSKPWREAVKQTVTGTVVAALSVEFAAAGCAKLANFAAWLLRYPGFLRSIALSSTCSYQDAKHYIRCAEDMLCSSLTQASERQQLQLQSYGSDFIVKPAILSLLPATTLRALDLKYGLVLQRHAADIVRANMLALPQVLHQFSNLQTLSVQSHRAITGNSLPSGTVTSISRLSHLTRLELVGIPLPEIRQLPSQLQHHNLGITAGFTNTTTAPLNLGHMHHLQSLNLSVERQRPVRPKILVPSQLTGLTAMLAEHSAIEGLGITALQQLQELVLEGSNDSPAQLQSLSGLVQLRKLGLQYGDAPIAEAACFAWSQLPYLCSLKLNLRMQPDAYDIVIEEVSQLTDLTDLVLDISVENDHLLPNCVPLQFVGFLGHLRKLRSLRVTFAVSGTGQLYEQEALVLTTLTQLTHLDLRQGEVVLFP